MKQIAEHGQACVKDMDIDEAVTLHKEDDGYLKRKVADLQITRTAA